MGKVLASGSGGGGTGSDECTASKAQVLTGYTAVTSDSGDEAVEGTMPNNGEQSATLKCGQSKQIPAGYTSGGTVVAADLASQTGGDATAAYIYKGKTAWVNGNKLTGNMTCQSVLSFSVAAYSTSQVLATWKNPSKGPFSGVIICAKIGGYPTNKDDSRVYTGVGSNSAANGTSSAIIGNLQAGQTYYFRIWGYVTCSAGNFYSGYSQATVKTTVHGRQAFTSSGTFTVPTAVRSINIHCTGGGGGGEGGSWRYRNGGSGGGGGHTSYKNGISVTPGTKITVTVGAGGAGGYHVGSDSSAVVNGTTYKAYGGNKKTDGSTYYSYGGSGGGQYGDNSKAAGVGGNNGGDGGNNSGSGQGTTTKEFGSGTLYAGGGGGGGYKNSAAGGSGGGGAGSSNTIGSNGSAGTGGGGGGGAASGSSLGGTGGSGNVIITW